MRATFTASISKEATNPRDPQAVFQTVMSNRVFPVVEKIVSTARANTKHKGVANAYAPGLSVVGNKVTTFVTNDHPLFRIIEGGSKPHTIVARNKPYLVFQGNQGHPVSVREVSHPGTPGAHNLRNAFQAHRSDTEQAIQEGVGEWLRESLGSER